MKFKIGILILGVIALAGCEQAGAPHSSSNNCAFGNLEKQELQTTVQRAWASLRNEEPAKGEYRCRTSLATAARALVEAAMAQKLNIDFEKAMISGEFAALTGSMVDKSCEYINVDEQKISEFIQCKGVGDEN
jgi:hypothetical protein